MVNCEFLQFSQTLVLWTPTATSLRRNLYSRLLVVTWLQRNGKHLGEPSVGKAPLINSTDARFDIVDLRNLCEGIGSRTNRQESQVRCDKLWFPLNRLRESRVHWSNISPQVGWSLVVTTARSFLSSKVNMIGVYIRTTATPHKGVWLTATWTICRSFRTKNGGFPVNIGCVFILGSHRNGAHPGSR